MLFIGTTYDVSCHTMQEEDLSSPLVVDTLNSVMACGELPTLYTNDEMEGLLQVSFKFFVVNLMLGAQLADISSCSSYPFALRMLEHLVETLASFTLSIKLSTSNLCCF